mmetsp:Transcript_1880/g.5091  ORF Transcript_1880/g.5091 Transcript_1880/m.5091 type:complete len:248 (+) Transcript_1880:97-840(+)
MKTALALSTLLVLAAAQSTCPCSENDGAQCSSIVSIGNDACVTIQAPCSGCVCDPSGLQTCTVVSAPALQFNGTANLCELSPVEIASCPGSTNVVPRQCCFSGLQGFTMTCDLGEVIPNVESISYVYNVDGLGTFTFQPPAEPLDITIEMTPISTALNGAPNFLSAQVGFNSTTASISSPDNLVKTITTAFDEVVTSFTAGDPRFDYLAGNMTFQAILSATMGESGGDASRSNTLEGCFDFSFVTTI